MKSINHLLNLLILCFLISMLTIEIKAEIWKINFKRSKFNVIIEKKVNSIHYSAKLYNGVSLLQNVHIGVTHPGGSIKGNESSIEISSGSGTMLVNLFIKTDLEDYSVLVVNHRIKQNLIVTDCFDLEPESMNWYGGPEHKLQLYPVQKMKLENFAYIPIEGGGIMERFWLNSRGISIYVHSETPLFVDQNSMQADRMCFTAKQSMPYDTTMENFNFYYQIGFNSDARRSQNHFVNYNVFYKPSTIPNIKLIEKPMWNTWVRYGRNINEKKIRDFISEISQNNFTYSMMIIDDFWEKCYGSMTVDKLKFPNMKSLITEIKTKYTGILFSLWIHPFINKNCNPYYDNAKKSNFFVKSATGSIDTSWWDSTLNDAAYIDFSDPHTKDWFQGKLYELKKETGVDGFKFVAGATSFLPKNAILKNTKIYQPADIIKCYSNIALHFKDTMDITTGLQTQKYGLIIRMNGFNSRWTIDNGLQALIPRLIQINLSGYLFVLPDHVGGNRYGEDITKELFIRWLQANVFMASIQFSVTPWDFDEETVEIAKKFIKLHSDYSEFIIQRFKLAIARRDPVNSPIWWLDPADKVAQIVSDQFLLGETILSAPVVEKGKTQRDIYLPVGCWKDGNNGSIYNGKRWLKNYPAPLDVLPYFIRQYNKTPIVSNTTIKTIYFKRSKVSATIFKKDDKYFVNIYNGNAFLQQVLLDKHLGNQTLEIVKISNGYELFTVGKPVRISISIDTDVEDFSVLEIGRKMNNNDVATDCVALDHSNIKVHWYGASTLYEFSSAFDERYWLNSLGVSIYIEYDVPLFVDGDQQLNNHICFTAKAAFPYSSDNKFNFKYKIGFSSNARKTHINAMNHFFEIPKSYPDENLIKHLIWSTHGIFGRSLTQDQIHNFMNEAITKLGIHSSMLIIDDGWESCYGSLAVDETKFPNMKNLITIIKTQFIGMKVELYVRPIIESSCKDNFNFAKNNNYLVKSATGSVFMDTVLKPDLTKETTHIDFSNPDATKWFKSRLEKLKAETGADGFKFAWGSQIHLPSNTKPQFNKSFSPNILTSNFVKMAAELGSSSVVRAGWKTQDQNLLSGIAINYSKFDGMPLILMIPTWIQMNMIGYPFILTECNYHDGKNHFIRMLQAKIFMPTNHLCVGPWIYDQQTVDITKKFSSLHLKYSELIIERFKLTTVRGDPVNPPIWWLDPEDSIAHTITDQYLLGETIMVAPILHPDKFKRDIYFPLGNWKEGETGQIYPGKRWVKNYNVPLDVLPYFIRQIEPPSSVNGFMPEEIV